ncbi:hypothetical protein HYV50_00725 [Candidatus Pacearchaeota archaeon]|nr:hypothetical protein [Candidatus Pacearchaeota archaeon]
MDKKTKTITAVIVVVVLAAVVAEMLFLTDVISFSPDGSLPECSDRWDNDNDGYCDYIGNRIGCRSVTGAIKGDSGCSSAEDNTECDPAPETCNNLDDDCDGLIDEQLTRTCGSDVGECQAGTQTCSIGNWGTCQGSIGPTTETCDLKDNDCDGIIDENNICYTCAETDGGFLPGAFGIVSGTRGYRSFYSYNDTCLTSTNLLEWYCSGNFAINSTYECNQTARCSSGACKNI